MKNITTIPPFFLFFLLITFLSCTEDIPQSASQNNDDFTFVFLTDIHLQPELGAPAGFKQAIDSVNKINPEFVITGGDLIMDALGQTFDKSDSLYNLYTSMIKEFNMPVYNTMGNHEVFGIYSESGVPDTHPEYGEKMFENRIGPRYYSFEYKGWHFIILDGIEDTGENSYIGKIDSVQMQWINNDLKKIENTTPIVISVHIPLLTVITQLEKGATEPNSSSTVITNAKEVLELFDGFNLKLVLQGHLHYVEDIYVNGTHFITGGAVSSKWWGGKYLGTEEGFVVVKVKGDEFLWEYIDYGWEAEEVDVW